MAKSLVKPRRTRNKKTVRAPSNKWQVLCHRIQENKLIPIIGNSVRRDSVFDVDYDGTYGVPDEPDGDVDPADPSEAAPTIGESLAQIWADEIGYPLSDGYQLSRVADFHRRMYHPDDYEMAKRKYLAFLKRALVWVAEDDDVVEDQVQGLKPESLRQTSISEMDDAEVLALENHLSGFMFSDIAAELGYPKFNESYRDPLQILANLNLPLYLTTSSHDFLERALHDAGRTEVRTQVCHWFGEASALGGNGGPVSYGGLAPEHVPAERLELDPERPIVYHLFGYEEYPSSLVLTEDDYLDFLVRVVQEGADQTGTILPHAVTAALRQSSVLLLGYRLQDWEFKVLFRGILRKTSIGKKTRLVIQLDPNKQAHVQEPQNPLAAHEYLRKYFAPHYRVDWGTTEMFLDRLEQEWNSCRSDLL